MTEARDIVMTVQRREPEGKGAAGRLRQEGRVPAVVYGGDRPPVPISVNEKDVKELLKQESGENTIFLLKLEGTKDERTAMIRELQVDPLTGRFVHIDFIRIVKGHKLTVDIPVELKGDSIGVRNGGRVDFVTRELNVELLPREMFDHFSVDISKMQIGDSVTVADLADQLPENGRFLAEGDRVIVLVEPPRKPTAEEAAEDAAAELESVLGEAAEPEVIGHSKDDE